MRFLGMKIQEHKSICYVYVSIPALEIDSSVLFF